MDSEPSAATATADTSLGFFYGTLMAPEVFYTVCYQSWPPPAGATDAHVFSPAVLSGYCRHRVRYADYPGIVADESTGATVRGIVVSGLTATHVARLDHFEGSEYDRVPLQVHVDGKDIPVVANVYVYKIPSQLERREWDFDEFRNERMRLWTRADYTFDGTRTAAESETEPTEKASA